jgi:acyl-coenzyme A synthetase/AMP-(fatty) acid ligase
MGLARGSRVLLVMLDTPEYVAAIFGAMRAGFVPGARQHTLPGGTRCVLPQR